MSFQSILHSKFFTIAAVLLVGWLGLSAVEIKSHTSSLEQKKEDLSGRAQKIEDDNARLDREIQYGKNPLFLEKEARTKLNLKSPDEQVVFIYGTQTPTPASSSHGEKYPNLDNISNIKKWFYYLLGY